MLMTVCTAAAVRVTARITPTAAPKALFLLKAQVIGLSPLNLSVTRIRGI